jgi:hypothetical protein
MQMVAAGAALALLVAAGFFFFRGSGDGEDKVEKKVEQIKIEDIELTVGGVYNANTGLPAQLSPELQNAVMATVGTYVQGGLIDPVRDGKAGKEIAGIFDALTAPRLTGPDRAVLFEEDLPELTGTFTPTAEPVILTALSDPGGNFVLVTARLTYQATLEVKKGIVTITRNGELTLVPEGDTWKITGYDVGLIRELPGAPSPTTTAAKS